MHRRWFGGALLSRVAMVATTAALSTAVVCSGQVSAATATPGVGGRVVIDTWDDWEGGETYSQVLGCPDEVSNVGQGIIVPAGMHTLKKFTFSFVSTAVPPGRMV